MNWNAKLVNKSFPWVEKQIVHRPMLAPWQRAFRDSLLEAGVSPFNGFTYDHIYGTKVGGTIFDRFGRRHTAADLLASGNPQKLTVLVYATVQKVVFDTSGEDFICHNLLAQHISRAEPPYAARTRQSSH